MIREAGLNPASLHFQETQPIAAVVAITLAVVAKIQVIATLVAIIAIPVTIIAVLVAIAVLIAVIAALFAGFVGFVPFMAPAIGLTAVIAVVLDGFAQLMLRVLNAALAIIRFRARRPREESETTQRGGRQCCPAEHCLTKRGLPQIRMQSHTSSMGASLVLVGVCLRPCIWNTATRKMSLGREEKSGSTMRSEHDRTESSLRKSSFWRTRRDARTRRRRDLFIKDSQTRA